MASLPGQREVDRLLEQIRTRVSELRRLEVARADWRVLEQQRREIDRLHWRLARLVRRQQGDLAALSEGFNEAPCSALLNRPV
jgi:hypothetical protein